MSADSKFCPDCQRTLPAADFRRNVRGAGGLSAYCRQCFRVRDAASYERRQAAKGAVVRPRLRLEGFKRCADCDQVKPETDFHRAAAQSGGRAVYCKPCRSVRERAARFRRLYGLSPEALAQMIDEQGGRCAICRERPAEHVDHDHLTGTVRRVLCFPCNAALGHFLDRPDLLRAAIDYLETTTCQRTRVCTGVYRLTSPRPGARRSASSSALRHLISSRRAASSPPAS